jgi:hypothetical protein
MQKEIRKSQEKKIANFAFPHGDFGAAVRHKFSPYQQHR